MCLRCPFSVPSACIHDSSSPTQCVHLTFYHCRPVRPLLSCQRLYMSSALPSPLTPFLLERVCCWCRANLRCCWHQLWISVRSVTRHLAQVDYDRMPLVDEADQDQLQRKLDFSDEAESATASPESSQHSADGSSGDVAQFWSGVLAILTDQSFM